MLRASKTIIVCGFASILGLTGCGGSSGPDLDLVAAEGTVTLEGKPLENARVTFYPDEEGRPATGLTDSSGHFELTTIEPGDGAMVGSHKVTVIINTSASDNPTSAEDYAVPNAKSAGGSAIPAKYASTGTSGLTASVTEDGENDFKFDLKKQ